MFEPERRSRGFSIIMLLFIILVLVMALYAVKRAAAGRRFSRTASLGEIVTDAMRGIKAIDRRSAFEGEE